MVTPRIALFVVGLLTLSGCGLTEPRWGLRRGEIASDPLHLVLPPVVTAGEPASISVTTYGDCLARKGVTLVNVTGMTATIEPYDSVAVEAPRSYACPDILLLLTHTAAVTFPQAGDATLRIIGLAGGSLVTRERAVSVQ